MANYFNIGLLTRLADQHVSGARDHSAVLWSLLMFESFLRTQTDGVAAAPVRAAV
jgi:asparagine synthase (glutamine-hydrolysing)